MSDIKITAEMTLFEVTEKYPETIPAFVENGFAHVGDEEKRTKQGKMVTLEQAMMMKGKDFDTFRGLLVEAVENSRESEDVTLNMADDSQMFPSSGDIKVAGLLPCPVRLPLIEAFEQVRDDVEKKHDLKIGYRLAAASIGMDAVEKEMLRIKTQDDLPHLFLSAGFEAFFDHKNMARFKDKDVFVDRSWENTNTDFTGIDLKDPDSHFSMISVVPAIFLVDKTQLQEGEEIPRTWKELLDPKFERRVAMPVGDFDLFNGILLTLYKHYGEDGIRGVARNLLKSMHPSQAAGRFAGRQEESPAITVIPYFFSKMAHMNPNVEIVWPDDGAIISPVFMLEQTDAPEGTKELADFFMSKETGAILSQRGLFPSLNPGVENPLPENASWLWLGWDFIKENDLGVLIPKLLDIFTENAEV
ncbi:MAG: ABC transporter substrate-binding protein [bacterium]|nr:ABC transporter substrate-binding protein [bacterium]MCP4799145.1 ABC transporter substrate-binding protein [bacterium]